MLNKYCKRFPLLLMLAACLSLFSGFSARAQPKFDYKPPDLSKSFEQAQRERAEEVSKIGLKSSGGSVCQKCPAACEQVCATNDYKCVAETDKRREPHLARCRKNGQL